MNYLKYEIDNNMFVYCLYKFNKLEQKAKAEYTFYKFYKVR